MSEPMTRASMPSGWRGAAVRAALTGMRATLVVSPRPTVWFIRRQFAESGRQLAARLRPCRPPDVVNIRDVAYDRHGDTRLDVSYPQGTPPGDRLPTVVWTHGGAFVGGDKSEADDYLRLIAASGLTVVGINYTLAPRGRYPTPVRQLMKALEYLQSNADRFHIDPHRVVLAGDSAGAHISAQAAAAVANPEYAQRLGVTPTIRRAQLRGVVLCCGIYDLTLISPYSPVKDFLRAVAWAYSGARDYLSNDWFMSTMAIPDHVTGTFPPSFVTVGNADPLAPQSQALLTALQTHNVEVDVLVFAADHEPALGHEYQFEMDLDDGTTALRRLVAFVHAQTTGRHPDTADTASP